MERDRREHPRQRAQCAPKPEAFSGAKVCVVGTQRGMWARDEVLRGLEGSLVFLQCYHYVGLPWEPEEERFHVNKPQEEGGSLISFIQSLDVG